MTESNSPTEGLRYRDAGVDIDAASKALAGIKEAVKRTFDEHVLRDIGSFGAMYSLKALKEMEEPVLVSSVDGVGTKLKLAFAMEKHDTIGIDLVSHCVNDILVQGARPLFFLDYLAFGKLDPTTVQAVITGLATGCRYAGCALIGGETAEMPDMYQPGEYDVAGTIVGVADRARIVDGSKIRPGDILIGLKSTGLHTNGYSLARKICFEVAGLSLTDPLPGTGKSVGEALLEPHRSYSKVIQIVSKIVPVKGMVHVTGGGITDNTPRILPEGLGVSVDLSTWKVPPIFTYMQQQGRVAQEEMLRTFNMGIGYIVVVAAEHEDKALDAFSQTREEAKVIGTVLENSDGVSYTGTLNHA